MPTFRVDVNLEFGAGGPGLNVWEFRSVGNIPLDPADLGYLEAAALQLQGVYTDWRQVMTNDVTISCDGVFTQVNADDPSQYDVAGWTMQGSVGGAAAPQELALMASLKTAVASRHSQGRKFVGPLAQTALQENGTPTEVARGHVQDGIDRVVAYNQQVNNGAFVIYSRTRNLAYDITRGSCPNHFGVLRSRRNPG